MTIRRLTLSTLDDVFAVCKLDRSASIPVWASGNDLVSITRTADELSIVCRESAVPEGIVSERGWRGWRVAGAVPFSAVGVLASLTQPLAEAGIGVFVISTFDTDYLLVKDDQMPKALEVLRDVGHSIDAIT